MEKSTAVQREGMVPDQLLSSLVVKGGHSILHHTMESQLRYFPSCSHIFFSSAMVLKLFEQHLYSHQFHHLSNCETVRKECGTDAESAVVSCEQWLCCLM